VGNGAASLTARAPGILSALRSRRPMSKTRVLRRTFALLAVATTTVAAAILVSTAAIVGYGVLVEGEEPVATFAVAVAEPLGLLASLGMVLLAARRASWTGFAAESWRLACGIAGSVGLLSSAWWVGDLDLWTLAAAIALPSLTILGGDDPASPPDAVERPARELASGESFDAAPPSESRPADRVR
jgi:pimeloyl-ACP methyl ester carboxylesterase